MSDNRGGFTPPPRKKIALDNAKLKLSADCPTAPGKRSNLVWQLVNNNPRITVYTGDPDDNSERTGYGKIVAALDLSVFFAFIQMIKQMATGPADNKIKIVNKNFTFFGGKRSDAPSVVSELWVGKDKDGQVWISVLAPNRPKIRFFITNPDFHALEDASGAPLDRGQVSSFFALGFASLLEHVYGNLAITEYTEPPPPKDRNGGGGGGYNRGGQGGGGGGQQRQAPAPSAGVADEGSDGFPF